MLKKAKSLVPQGFKNIYHLFVAVLANLIYLFPSRHLKVIGVTGTDGKTTTVSLIEHLLKKADFKVSMISTVNAPGLHTTTPDPLVIQRYLRNLVREGIEYAIVEVTSQALDQYRVWGVNFFAAVLTNITHEHLDYHQTLENYTKAKAKLFGGVKFSFLNKDDSSFGTVSKVANGKIITYGIKEKSDFQAEKINLQTSGSDVIVKGEKFHSPLIGEFNIYNLLAGVAVAKTLGLNSEVINKGLADFVGVEGRMQVVGGKDFEIVVDFAHTPNGLKNSLVTLRKIAKGDLIAVFGSAGERDKLKRPLMGSVSAQFADKVIITLEDPRSEPVEKISENIAQGLEKKGKKLNKDYWIINDRREAIKFSIEKLAKKGDIIGVFGKGHERSMNIKGKEYPWSDQQAILEILKGRKND